MTLIFGFFLGVGITLVVVGSVNALSDMLSDERIGRGLSAQAYALFPSEEVKK